MKKMKMNLGNFNLGSQMRVLEQEQLLSIEWEFPLWDRSFSEPASRLWKATTKQVLWVEHAAEYTDSEENIVTLGACISPSGKHIPKTRERSCCRDFCDVSHGDLQSRDFME